VRKIVNVLSAGMQVAVDDGRIPANPAARLKMPKQNKLSAERLTRIQLGSSHVLVRVSSVARSFHCKEQGENMTIDWTRLM
jgi:hypothetical protein